MPALTCSHAPCAQARLDATVAASFAGDEAFVRTLKDAFAAFINKRSNKPAEMLAKYIDARLRGGNKESRDDELEGQLDAVLVLFRFIDGTSGTQEHR